MTTELLPWHGITVTESVVHWDRGVKPSQFRYRTASGGTSHLPTACFVGVNARICLKLTYRRLAKCMPVVIQKYLVPREQCRRRPVSPVKRRSIAAETMHISSITFRVGRGPSGAKRRYLCLACFILRETVHKPLCLKHVLNY